MVDINAGDGTLMFNKALPKGSAFFFTDIDATEYFDLQFVDCSGNPVDAGGFTFLQMSLTPPLNNVPTHTLLGSAPNRYWRVADPVAGGGSVNQSTNGLLIDSSAVCGVQIAGNPLRGRGGGTQFAFGLPGASLLQVTKSVALVNGQAPQSPTVTLPGDVVEYAITLRNPETTPLTVAAGAITETVPANTTLVAGMDFSCAANAAGASCSNTAALTVAPGASTTVRMRVKVDAVNPASITAISNTVAVKGLDCAAAGNTCTVNTPTAAPSVAPVPTLSELSLALLGMLLGGLAFVRRGVQRDVRAH